MTSATEVLRRLLDERGVEWEDMSDEYEWYTEWVPEMLVKHHHRHRTEPVGFFESTWRKKGEMATGLVLFGNKHHRHCIYDLTPAQAIAATLGTTDAKPTQAESSGTCHNAAPSYLDFLCSACGFVHYHSDTNDTGDGNEWRFCPNCGRRIEQ